MQSAIDNRLDCACEDPLCIFIVFTYKHRTHFVNTPISLDLMRMSSALLYVLLVELLTFALIGTRCGWIFITTTRFYSNSNCLSGQEGGRNELVSTEAGVTETDSAGAAARRRVQTVLGVACILRAAVTAFVLRRVSGPYLVVPDLLFMCTYGQLVLFLVQTQQTATGLGYRSIRQYVGASIFLSALLVVSLVTCAVRWRTDPSSSSSQLLWDILYYELGAT